MKTSTVRVRRNRIAASATIVTLFAASPFATHRAEAQILIQGFDNVSSLTTQGFVLVNNSFSPPTDGSGSWGQGDPDVFTSQSGAANSYIAVGYQSTGGTDATGDTISNWLLTPTVALQNGEALSFYTRTVDALAYADQLQVRLSTAGSSTNVGSTPLSVGDFSNLLLTINPNLLTGSENYPTSFTKYSLTLSGLPVGITTGRFGFRYFVTNSGINGLNGDYIGLDTLSITNVSAAPEPASLVLLALSSLPAISIAVRRRSRAS